MNEIFFQQKRWYQSTWFVITFTFLLTAIAVGGAVYWLQQSRVSGLENELMIARERVEELQAQVMLEPPVIPPPNIPTASLAPAVIMEPVAVPTDISAADDKALLQQAFAEKYNQPVTEISVTIQRQVGIYATGGVSIGQGPGGGGIWFGVKQNGKWIIAADGNGLPMCANLDAYDIPVTLAASCVGQDGNMVNR